MAVSDDKIKELLAAGLPNSTVASAVGCSESYISQLMANEEFREDVINRKTAALTANTKRDLSIDSIEDKVIAKLEELVDGNHIYKPQEVLRTFQVLNAAKRRGISANEHLHAQQTVVQLQIPPEFLRRFTGFTIDGKGEVIESDGQTLVSMPASTLLKQLSGASTDSEEQRAIYQNTAKHLPDAVAANRETITRRSDIKNSGWRGDANDV